MFGLKLRIWRKTREKNLTAKLKKNQRLVYPLSMTHKSRPDYNNQELGTTKARRTVGSSNLWFAGAQRKGTKEREMITREQERLVKKCVKLRV
jgi:hypothetical protein